MPSSGSPSLSSISSLGLKDHGSVPIDINKGDKNCTLATYAGLKSLRLPDSIQAVQVDGKTYILTANEGDDKAAVWDNLSLQDQDMIKPSEQNAYKMYHGLIQSLVSLVVDRSASSFPMNPCCPCPSP